MGDAGMKYAFVQQFDSTDCAAACLAMICMHYDRRMTITKLREMMGTDIKGTNLLGLSKATGELGFVNQAVKVDREGFDSDFTLPCIAHVITHEGMSHFVVLYKKLGNHVLIGDPAKRLRFMRLKDFFQIFTGAMLLMAPQENFFVKEERTQGTLSRFIKLLAPEKKMFLTALFASLVITALGIGSSMFYKILMDDLLPGGLHRELTAAVLFFVTLGVMQSAVGFLKQWVLLRMSQRVITPVIFRYFEHIYRLPMKFFATRKTGDLVTRFQDAFTIRELFSNMAIALIMNVTLAFMTGVVLYAMAPGLFGIIAALTAASLFLLVLFRRPFQKVNEQLREQSAMLNSRVVEGLSAVETVKGNGSEELELDGIKSDYCRFMKTGLREGMLANIQGTLSSLLQVCGQLLLLYVGAGQVMDKTMSLGTLMAFSTLSVYFMEPVGELIGLQLEIQEAGVSMRRVTEVMESEEENTEGTVEMRKAEAIKGEEHAAARQEGDIEFCNVTFRYGHREPVIKNLNLLIRRGHKVAIVGESGSGKSTLTKLLLGYDWPEEGTIRIGGINIEELGTRRLRSEISYVSQSIELFSRSIFDNIRISRPNATRQEVMEAAKRAGAHEFIERLPMKYDNYVEEAGAGLSGGEKQRIALARAFLKDSSLYILDEPTSSLDAAAEQMLFDTIDREFDGKTMIIIAHRLSTVRKCDWIIVMEHGQVAEEGTFSELMEKQGIFSSLCKLQKV